MQYGVDARRGFATVIRPGQGLGSADGLNGCMQFNMIAFSTILRIFRDSGIRDFIP